MMMVQRTLIDLLRARIKQLGAEQKYDGIPKFLRLTAAQCRKAWEEYDTNKNLHHQPAVISTGNRKMKSPVEIIR